MKQANTVRDKVECPKCENQFTTPRHKKRPKGLHCPKCFWDGSFTFLTKPEVE